MEGNATILEGLAIPLVVLFLLGIALLALGKKARRLARPIAMVAIFALIIVLIIAWTQRAQVLFEPEYLMRGWGWPFSGSTVMQVGLVADPLGWIMALLTAWTGLMITAAGSGDLKSPDMTYKKHRLHAAILMSVAGGVLAWTSLTVWVGLIGLALTVLGGTLAFSARWTENQEARVALQYIRQKATAFILAAVGAACLASKGQSLSWEMNATWSQDPSVVLAAALLGLGLFFSFQSFPLVGGVTQDEPVSDYSRFTVPHLFPSLAAHALFFRLMPRMAEMGINDLWLLIGVTSALLTTVTGSFQLRWNSALLVALSALHSLVFASLASGQPQSALSLLISGIAGLSLLIFSGVSLSSDDEPEEGDMSNAAVKVARTEAILGACGATGMFGFLASGAALRWIDTLGANPTLRGAVLFCLFTYGWLVWRAMFLIVKISPRKSKISSLALACGFSFLLIAAGVFWTGSGSAGSLPGEIDFWFYGPLRELFLSPEILSEEAYIQTALLFFPVLIFSILIAFVTTGRRQDMLVSLSQSAPRFHSFVSCGYGIDRFVELVTGALIRVGHLFREYLDVKFWNQGFPAWGAQTLRVSANTVARLDQKLSDAINVISRKSTNAPGKLLQLVQSGDVQWYLFFAIIMMVAIVVHFLRTL